MGSFQIYSPTLNVVININFTLNFCGLCNLFYSLVVNFTEIVRSKNPRVEETVFFFLENNLFATLELKSGKILRAALLSRKKKKQTANKKQPTLP